ncbi:MAG: hypothetical protein ACREOI_10795 [bacterium]
METTAARAARGAERCHDFADLGIFREHRAIKIFKPVRLPPPDSV